MKRTLPLTLVLLSLAACRLPWSEPAVNPDPNHTHADFAVWLHDQQVNFARDTFMSGAVSSEAPEEEGDHLHPYLHLHDGNGAVIHRHKPGLTLGAFFGSLGMEMTQTCFATDADHRTCNEGGDRWRMFVDGKERPFDPTYVFQDLDAILLTYGSSEAEIQEQLEKLTDDACLYSKTCPERGDPPTEGCIADPTVPCNG